LQGREQSAGDRRQRTGEQEDRDQHLRLGNTGGFRRDLGVAHRDQRAAEPAAGDVGAHPGGQSGKCDAEKVKAPRGIERRREFRPDDADAAAGDALPGQCDLRDDGGEAERRHREVKRAQAQRRQADDHAEQRADDAGDRQCGEDRHRWHDIARNQHARGVGAERQ